LYGNREFEDALRELKDLAVETGFRPIAGGAFIGEHSFAGSKFPIARRRPDHKDIEKCSEFGALIKEKIQQVDSIDSIPIPEFPGNQNRNTKIVISYSIQITVNHKWDLSYS